MKDVKICCSRKFCVLQKLFYSDSTIYSNTMALEHNLKYDMDQKRLRWISNEKNLKEFFASVTSDHEALNGGRWEEDRSRNTHAYKTSSIVVKWYSSTKTVSLEGKEHELLRSKLMQHITLSNSINASISSCCDTAISSASEIPDNNSDLVSDLTSQKNDESDNAESSDEETDNEEDNVIIDKLNFICSAMEFVKSDMKSLRESFQARIETL